MSSLTEFTNKVNGFYDYPASVMVDYFAFYLQNIRQEPWIVPKSINNCFDELAVPPYSNISRYLAMNSRKTRGKAQKFLKKKLGYVLTKTRSDEIARSVVDDAIKVEISSSLNDLMTSIKNESERIYLEEAIMTFQIGAYRAAIIMVWLLTIDHLYEYVLSDKISDFITGLRKMNNSKTIRCKDDFSDLKESTFIEACKVGGIISNDVKKILETKLGIRNSYAHPSTVNLPKIKALEFIEDLITNVLLKYQATKPQ